MRSFKKPLKNLYPLIIVSLRYCAILFDYYKWKNRFSEIKGDVGMSPHEKGGEQEDAYTNKETHS